MPTPVKTRLFRAAAALAAFGIDAADPWRRRSLITVNLSAYAISVSTLVYAVIYASYDFEMLRGVVYANLVMALTMPAIPFLHRRHEVLGGSVLIAIVYGAMFYIITELGRDSGIQTNYVAGAAICTLVYAQHHRTLGVAYVLISLALSLACWLYLPSDPALVARHSALYFSVFAFTQITAIGIVALALYYVMNVAARAEAASTRLIENMLPPAVAERLKTGNVSSVAQTHGAATVLAADLVGFSAYAHGRPPEAVVALLNRLFAAYDALAEKHEVEKIKTIGDGYLAAAGVLERAPDPPGRALRMAQEMIAVTREIAGAAGGGIGLRVGLHAGPVTSGVIGTRKFAFDIWGDTVNTAFRLEETAPPNRVQLSQSVREALDGRVPLEPRGRVEAKGIGSVETWLAAAPSGAGDRLSRG